MNVVKTSPDFVSGHHLTFIFNRATDFPDFMKHWINPWHLPGAPLTYTALSEGWALYAEYLGHEMNLYEDDPIQLVSKICSSSLKLRRNKLECLSSARLFDLV